MRRITGLITAAIAAILMACSLTSTPAAPGDTPTPPAPAPTSTVLSAEQKVSSAERGALCANYNQLPTSGRAPLAAGDCLRTTGDGRAWVYLLDCATIAVYGGSDLQWSQVNLAPTTGLVSTASGGGQLVSTTCGSIQLNLGNNPPEAVVQTTGTVFFTAHNPQKHLALLWTLVGGATITNVNADGSRGAPQLVREGTFSVVRDRQKPEAPRPVAEMGDIIAAMELQADYNDVVQMMTQTGFGQAAPRPRAIATIASPTPLPTPSPTPLTPANHFNHPTRLALNQHTGNVWVINAGDGSLTETSAVKPPSVLHPTPPIEDPYSIAIWQAKELGYVTDRRAGTVMEMNLLDHTSRVVARVDGAPTEIAVDEETDDLYVLVGGSVTRLDGANRTPQVLRLGTGGVPLRMEYSAEARRFWVLSCCTPEPDTSLLSAAVTPIFSGGKVGAPILVPLGDKSAQGPFGFALMPGGLGGYITVPDVRRVLAWSLRGPGPAITLDFAPYAIQNLGTCVGVIDAANSLVRTLDVQSLKPIDQWKIGGQSTLLEQASNLVYDARNDTFYVSDYLEDDLRFQAHPCPVTSMAAALRTDPQGFRKP
ncbi:MAG: hypothetical protein WCF84_27290 [Anaerolineae bacterium]